MRHRPSAREVWESAPWYEKLGMILYLSGAAYAFLNAIVRSVFR